MPPSSKEARIPSRRLVAMSEEELARALDLPVEALRDARDRFNAILRSDVPAADKQSRLIAGTEAKGLSDIDAVLAERLVARGAIAGSIGGLAEIRGIGEMRLRAVITGLLSDQPVAPVRSVGDVLREDLGDGDVVNVVEAGARRAIEVMTADAARTVAVTSELARSARTGDLDFDPATPIAATVLAGPSLVTFGLDPQTTLLLPLATVEDLPFYPAGERPLACGSDRLIAVGEGEAGPFDESFGQTIPPKRGPTPFTNLARDALIAAAQTDAVGQALEVMKRVTVSCATDCALQLDVLCGEPEIEALTASAGFFIQVSGINAERAYVPFELRARCRKTPVATGEVDTGVGPQLPRPSPCEGTVTTGLGRAVRGSNGSSGLSDKVMESLRVRALTRARTQIGAALDGLPLCPQASCPINSVTVTLGPFKLQRRVVGSVGGTPPTTLVRTIGVAEVPWRVEGRCTEG